MSREMRRSPTLQSEACAHEQGKRRRRRAAGGRRPRSCGVWRRSGAPAQRDLWDKHRISKSESKSWQRTFAEFGYAGLKRVQLQNLRRRGSRCN